MKIFTGLYPAWPDARISLGLLALRLIAGLGIMQHGWGKIHQNGDFTHAFGWMGPSSPIPNWAQACAALGEFGGGLGLIFGLLTPFATFGIASTMIGAFFIALRDAPWISTGKGQSSEMAGLYLVIALTIFFTGPGRYALDALLFPERYTDPERLRRV